MIRCPGPCDDSLGFESEGISVEGRVLSFGAYRRVGAITRVSKRALWHHVEVHSDYFEQVVGLFLSCPVLFRVALP